MEAKFSYEELFWNMVDACDVPTYIVNEMKKDKYDLYEYQSIMEDFARYENTLSYDSEQAMATTAYQNGYAKNRNGALTLLYEYIIGYEYIDFKIAIDYYYQTTGFYSKERDRYLAKDFLDDMEQEEAYEVLFNGGYDVPYEAINNYYKMYGKND